MYNSETVQMVFYWEAYSEALDLYRFKGNKQKMTPRADPLFSWTIYLIHLQKSHIVVWTLRYLTQTRTHLQLAKLCFAMHTAGYFCTLSNCVQKQHSFVELCVILETSESSRVALGINLKQMLLFLIRNLQKIHTSMQKLPMNSFSLALTKGEKSLLEQLKETLGMQMYSVRGQERSPNSLQTGLCAALLIPPVISEINPGQ